MPLAYVDLCSRLTKNILHRYHSLVIDPGRIVWNLGRADHGIRVTAIHPAEPLVSGEQKFGQERVAVFLDGVLLGQYGQPDEIGSVVVFSTSDLASCVIDETLAVGGGWISRR